MNTIVVIPTYNERENIAELVRQILEADAAIHVLIVDDRSPDGTADVVAEICQRSSRVHLLVRRGRRGRGLADLDGFDYAFDTNFDYIISMDADFSHQPQDIPRFLETVKTCDVVVGSRLIKGGAIVNRGFLRNAISRVANVYIRSLLGWGVHDWSSGFRCYRASVLASLPLEKMTSSGPSLLEEILFSFIKRGGRIREIPVTFYDRKGGKSKLGFRELWDTLSTVLKLRFKQYL